MLAIGVGQLRRGEARAGAKGTESRLCKRCAVAPLPGQSSTSTLVGGELWFGRGALRNAGEAEIRTYGSSVCFSYTVTCLYDVLFEHLLSFLPQITRR